MRPAVLVLVALLFASCAGGEAAAEDLDDLEPGPALDAVFGSAEGWGEFEERLLCSKTPQPGPQAPLEPWILERVRAAAECGFGLPAGAADALRRLHTLLDEVDAPLAPSPRRHR